MSRARIEDAFAFMAAGEIQQAVHLLTALAAETPAHATVHVLLAQGYERMHRWPDALAAWQAAALLLPDASVVRQGALRATRVLAALRTMADDGAFLAIGTPAGQRLVPVESPDAPPQDPGADPLATLSVTAGTPLPPPVALAPNVAAPETVPPQAVHVAPTLDARPYTPPATSAYAPAPLPEAAPLQTAAPPDLPTEWAPAPTAHDTPADAAPEPPALEAVSVPMYAPPAGLEGFFDGPPPESAPRTEAPPARSGFDLEHLIEQISQAGPIRPRADLDAIAPPLLEDDDEDPVSETLARIYAGQGQYAQALRIYERLAEQQPEHAARFRAEADALRPKATA